MYRPVRFSPTHWMFGMDHFLVGVLYRAGDGNPVVNTFAVILYVNIFPKTMYIGLIWRHLSSLSVSTQSLISLRIASFVVRLAIRVQEKTFDNAKLKASIFRSSVDGEVTVVVSVFGVDGVAGIDGAVEGPSSSAKRTFDGVECLSCITVPSSECDIIKTFWKVLAILRKLL